MIKTLRTIPVAALSVITISFSGCAYTSSIRDGSEVYGKPLMANAPRVAVAEFTDSRQNPKHIGQVAALAMNEPATPINAILTNRIASRLADRGFSIQKVKVSSSDDPAKVSSLIVSSGAKILISGDLNDFFVKSFDAMMESAKGHGSFSVKVFDTAGQVVLDRAYIGNAEHFIGLTGQFGSDKAIDKTIDASIDRLFADAEFESILQKIK